MTLLTRRGYFGVITFTDRGTKMMHSAPTRSLGKNAQITARHLYEQVVRHHGIPCQIVADRDASLCDVAHPIIVAFNCVDCVHSPCGSF